jgi:hypothetical protein
MGVKRIESFGDSKLIVKQIRGENQCLHGMLNQYYDRCIQLIELLDLFSIVHVHRSQNEQASMLQGMKSDMEDFTSRRSQYCVMK